MATEASQTTPEQVLFTDEEIEQMSAEIDEQLKELGTERGKTQSDSIEE